MKDLVSVYLTAKEIRLATVEVADKIKISQAASLSLNVDDFFSNLSVAEEKKLNNTTGFLRELLKTAKLLDSNAHIVIPDEMCSFQILNLPFVSEKEILSAIEIQAEEFIPYPLDKSSFDYQILAAKQEEKQMSVLVIATLQELIDRVADYFLDSGLYPTTIEPESTAFYRFFFSNLYGLEAHALMLMLNVGKKSTQVSILDFKNKILLMTYSFNLGINFFIRAIQNNLNLSLTDSIKTFSSLKTDTELYEKIIKPLFLEYAKEVQKILLASTKRIGVMPSSIFVYGEQTAVFSMLLKQMNFLSNTYVFSLSEKAFKKQVIVESAVDKQPVVNYLPLISTVL